MEASGSYSWLVDAMERLGHRPKLCNPQEAKRRMGLTHNTEQLDARGWRSFATALCQKYGFPSSELRVQRELRL